MAQKKVSDDTVSRVPLDADAGELERTLEVLGGKDVLKEDITDENDLRKAAQEGFPKLVVREAVKYMTGSERPAQDVMFTMVPKATYMRRERLSPDQSERVARVARVFAIAESILGARDKAQQFMFKRHSMLEGETPWEVCMSETGARQVEAILWRAAFGVAS